MGGERVGFTGLLALDCQYCMCSWLSCRGCVGVDCKLNLDTPSHKGVPGFGLRSSLARPWRDITGIHLRLRCIKSSEEGLTKT